MTTATTMQRTFPDATAVVPIRADKCSVRKLGRWISARHVDVQAAQVILCRRGGPAIKIMAARTGRPEYEIVDEALRRYLGLDTVATVWNRSTLSEDEAMALAYEELHAMRRERDLGE